MSGLSDLLRFTCRGKEKTGKMLKREKKLKPAIKKPRQLTQLEPVPAAEH